MSGKYQQITNSIVEDEEDKDCSDKVNDVVESTYITNSSKIKNSNPKDDKQKKTCTSGDGVGNDENAEEDDDDESTDTSIEKKSKFRRMCNASQLKKNFRPIFWIFVWVTLNVGLVFSNKYLFSKEDAFKFPVFIILTGTFMTFLGCCIAVFLFKISKFPSFTVLNRYKYMLTLTSLLQAATYVFENVSITFLPLSLNQILKSTGPAFVLILLFLLYRETFSKEIVISTIVIVFGASFTTLQNPAFNTYGFIYATISSASASLQTILIQKLLKDTELNALSVVLVTSLPSTIVIIPIFFAVEYKDLKEWTGDPILPTIFVIAIAVAAALYNISHFYIVKYTSALYFVIVGNAKVVFVVILSSIIWATKFVPINIVGMILTFLGFFSYNYFRYKENKGLQQLSISHVPILNSTEDDHSSINPINDNPHSNEEYPDILTINSTDDLINHNDTKSI
ncbi:hypothetical protein DLAC_06546 [Tieghemostelium lacteum]|uniref:Sugar phosphate transporter domain-containing protein n=1 Tax=Tieghemostelium lacteum TaxID=361077 RepID=A0A151ZF46_TIELA|nr:hypothetical protein DLAC_06546 [Tieghemostelium lacteum]|eukprot:KYQ92555.1 hypothetical protein DLAC_06546 [Tieghemostelium lacteum]